MNPQFIFIMNSEIDEESIKVDTRFSEQSEIILFPIMEINSI